MDDQQYVVKRSQLLKWGSCVLIFGATVGGLAGVLGFWLGAK